MSDPSLYSKFKKTLESEFSRSKFDSRFMSELKLLVSEHDSILSDEKENFQKVILDSVENLSKLSEATNLETEKDRRMQEELYHIKRVLHTKMGLIDQSIEKSLHQIDQEVKQFNESVMPFENLDEEYDIFDDDDYHLPYDEYFSAEEDYVDHYENFEFDMDMSEAEWVMDELIAGEVHHGIDTGIRTLSNESDFLEHGNDDNLTNDPKVWDDKTNSKDNQNAKAEGEPVATTEKSRSELDTTVDDETEGKMELDQASKKLDELQSAVDNLIGQTVTSSNANEYINKYNVIEQGISQFLTSLVPLVEDNQKRKAKRDEIEVLRSIWDSNKEKCEAKIQRYSKEYEKMKHEHEQAKSVDIVAESKMDNLKYVLDEWKTLNQLATTHTDRISREVDNLNVDMQKINKISYQISSFNLRLRTLVVTSEAYVSTLGISSQELSSIQKALNVSLEKIKTLEQEQLAISKGA